MMQQGNVPVTAAGLKKLRDELDHLKNVRRPEIADKLQKAIADGDLKENANYHDAKEQQGLIEGRIIDLEESIRNAYVIQEDAGPTNIVRVGHTVVIAEIGFEDEEEEYRIVGKHEADPSNGLISNESPIGQALLGAKRGQTVTVNSPRGATEFKVIKIK